MSSSYRDLIVWQKAMDLVEAIYRATASFPELLNGLTSQLRRASVSVASKIKRMLHGLAESIVEPQATRN